MSRFFLLASIIAAIILAGMLFFTTPAMIGTMGIFLFFILTYVVMLGVTTTLVRIFARLVHKKKEMGRREYADAAVLAFWPVTMMVFISLGTANLLPSLIGVTISIVLTLFVIRKMW